MIWPEPVCAEKPVVVDDELGQRAGQFVVRLGGLGDGHLDPTGAQQAADPLEQLLGGLGDGLGAGPAGHELVDEFEGRVAAPGVQVAAVEHRRRGGGDDHDQDTGRALIDDHQSAGRRLATLTTVITE